MKKFLRTLSWLCFGVVLFCFLAILGHRRQAEEIFEYAQIVWVQSDRWLLLAMGAALLLGGALCFVSRSPKSPLFWVPFAAALSLFAWVGVPILQHHQSGTLAEAIDRQISDQATVIDGFLRSEMANYPLSVYPELSDQEMEQMEELLRTCVYSACAPDEILQREEIFFVEMPYIALQFQNPADRSRTYYLTIYCDNPHYGVLEFNTSTYDPEVEPLLCRLESPAVYAFIQDREDQMVPFA